MPTRIASLAFLLSLCLGLWALPAAGGPSQSAASEETPRQTVLVFRGGRELRGTIRPPRPDLHPALTPDGTLYFRSDSGARVDAPPYIEFISENGVTTRHSLSQIERIILPQQQAAAEASALLPDIMDRYRRGELFLDPSGMLRQAAEIHRLNSRDSEVRNLVEKFAWEVYTEGRRLARQGETDRAFALWDPLVVFLGDTNLPLVDVNSASPVEVDLRDQMDAEIAQALQARVQSLLQQATHQSPPDQELVARAADYNARLLSQDPNAYMGQKNEVVIAQLRGDLQDALTKAQRLQRNFPDLDFAEQQYLELTIRDLQSRLARAAGPEPPQNLTQFLNESGQPAQPAPPAPGPTPRPGPRPQGQPVPSPDEMPGLGGTRPIRPGTGAPVEIAATPNPTATGTPMPGLGGPTAASTRSGGGGFWVRVKRHWAAGDWGALVGDFGTWSGENRSIVMIVGGGLGLILVFWVIPYRLSMRMARAGNISASLWAPRVKRYGLVAAAAWMASPVFQRRQRVAKTQNLCPHCGGDLGNLDLYRELNFLACPHCQEGITPIYDLSDYIEHLIKQIDRVRGGRQLGDEFMGNVVEREAMLKLVRAVITLAVRRRASDLHVDASGDGLDLRLRVDGILAPMEVHVPKAVERAFVSAIKVMADLDITERRAPQDGRFEITVDGSAIDMRINTSPTGLGEKISIRVLDARTVHVPIERLGLSDEAMPAFRQAIMTPHGMMLVTGPTGCGKSTTLYVVLNEINNGTRNIVTIEDPIEFIFRGLNQHQVNPAAGFTFATGLRSIIRQDPDVIMVGEIRDRETADIAVDAATTGHLVMTTLHTIDAAGAYQRLVEFGIDPRRFAPSLLVIVAQRLIRIICEHCKEVYTPEPGAMRQLDLASAGKDVLFHHGKGCDRCRETGYHGRSGLFEVMAINEEIRQLMESHSPLAAVREAAKRSGMRNLREEGILRALRGLTTPEEVLRVIS